MMIIVRHWLILLMVLSGTSTGLAQGFDVDRGEPPPTHSSPTVYRLNSPLFEKYRLLVMPPCRDAVFNECSDWAINLLSHGGFVPVNIRTGPHKGCWRLWRTVNDHRLALID